MDMHQLRCLAAVSSELNFNKAANRLHMAQSALSRQIMILEKEIGLPLLIRNKRAPVRLTEAGTIFLASAQTALDHFERVQRVGQRLKRGELGKVTIGYVASATFSGRLPATMLAYRQHWPDVEIDLKEMDSDHQIEALAAGDIDIGFFRPRPFYPVEIETVVLLREAVLLALWRDHPLAGRPIRASDLHGSSFIVPQSGDESGFSQHAAMIARQGRFPLRFSHHVRDFVSVLSLVGGGLGIAPVPASLQCVHSADVVYRSLEDCALQVELMAAFRRHEQAATIIHFIDVIRGLAVTP